MMIKRIVQLNHVNRSRFTQLAQSSIRFQSTESMPAPPSAKKDKKKFNPEQTQRILSTGISITVPPMHLSQPKTLPKPFGKQLTPEELQELEGEQFKTRMKEAVGYVPEGYEFGKKPQTIEEFAERRKEERQKLEAMLKQEDLDPEMRQSIKEVLELEDMIRDYIKQENPEDPTDSSKEPRIPGIDYEKFNSTGQAQNEPLSNLASKYYGRNAGHGSPATWKQILVALFFACIASGAALGLARPGFEKYILFPILEVFSSKKAEEEKKE